MCSVRWTVTETRWTSICRKPEIVKRPRYFSRRLYRIRTIELHACCAWTGAASTRQRFEICGPKAYRCGVDEGPNDTPTIELNRTDRKSTRLNSSHIPLSR